MNPQTNPAPDQRSTGRGRGDGGSAGKPLRKKAINESVGGAAAVARDAFQEAPRAEAAASRPDNLFASDGRRLFENIPANRKEQIL